MDMYGPITTELDRALGRRGWLNAYGCTRCQKWHYEDEPIYQQHIGFQSKHGIRRVREEVVANARAED